MPSTIAIDVSGKIKLPDVAMERFGTEVAVYRHLERRAILLASPEFLETLLHSIMGKDGACSDGEDEALLMIADARLLPVLDGSVRLPSDMLLHVGASSMFAIAIEDERTVLEAAS